MSVSRSVSAPRMLCAWPSSTRVVAAAAAPASFRRRTCRASMTTRTASIEMPSPRIRTDACTLWLALRGLAGVIAPEQRVGRGLALERVSRGGGLAERWQLFVGDDSRFRATTGQQRGRCVQPALYVTEHLRDVPQLLRCDVLKLQRAHDGE